MTDAADGHRSVDLLAQRNLYILGDYQVRYNTPRSCDPFSGLIRVIDDSVEAGSALDNTRAFVTGK
ncbi:hypothetical protein Vi05172_g8969 [Venturia inaequalis]|nr:hypothetical protein Vi05172_g8969 [Venturia inaequalis]